MRAARIRTLAAALWLVWLTLINVDDLTGCTCTVIYQQWDTYAALLAGSLQDISIWTENLQFQLSACELSTRSRRELNHIKCFCWRDAREAVDFGISESRKQLEGIPHQSWCLGPCWWATWGSHKDHRHRLLSDRQLEFTRLAVPLAEFSPRNEPRNRTVVHRMAEPVIWI